MIDLNDKEYLRALAELAAEFDLQEMIVAPDHIRIVRRDSRKPLIGSPGKIETPEEREQREDDETFGSS